MHFQNLVLAAAFATSIASPVAQLDKREEKTWDENGNLKLTFSKETVTLGTIKIDDIAGKLFEVCHESGQCETNDIKMDGQLLNTDSVENIELTLGPDGSYPTWIRNGLVDALIAAVHAIAKCEDTTHKPTCPNPMVYCPSEPTTVSQCEVPKFWGINFQSPDEPNSAPPNIATDLDVQPVDSSLCEDALTGLGAVAGAVNGVAGGIFTLLNFACN